MRTSENLLPNTNHLSKILIYLTIRLVGWLILGQAILNLISLIDGLSLSVFDPVLGVPMRYAKIIFCCLQFLVGIFCLFAENIFYGTVLLAWMMTNIAVYSIGLFWYGCHVGFGCIGNALYSSNLITEFPNQVGLIALGIWLFVSYGGCLYLWFTRINVPLNASSENGFHKISCPFCGVRIQFDLKNLFQRISCPQCQKTITLRKPGFMKTICTSCREHLEVPTHALGQIASCPHCLNNLTIKELA